MNKLYHNIITYKLIYLSIAIHLLFYVSVAWTGWFDIFFSGAALHVGAKGIDFYHIPRGAWAFWHGGSLTGDPLADGHQYGKQYYALPNMYHPLFTLVFGTFLMQFNPAASPYIWLGMKFIITLAGVGVFYWSFREQKYVQFAVFIMLVSGNMYIELAAWQFHQVLNICLLLFLICLVKKKTFWLGTLYWLGLLAKPVGLLFLPALILKKRWKEAWLGLALFLFATLIFWTASAYYINSLLANFLHPGTWGPNQIITLRALLYNTTHWPDPVDKTIEYMALAIVILLSAFQRIHISKAIFLSVVFFLCFYDMVFEYQWSTLNYVVAVCLMCNSSFQTRLSRICMALICLPSGFILLNFFHIDVMNEGYWGFIPGTLAWQWIVISKLIPLFMLTGSVLASDIKPLYRQLKAFCHAMSKVNEYLGMFGEEEETARPIQLSSEFEGE